MEDKKYGFTKEELEKYIKLIEKGSSKKPTIMKDKPIIIETKASFPFAPPNNKKIRQEGKIKNRPPIVGVPFFSACASTYFSIG